MTDHADEQPVLATAPPERFFELADRMGHDPIDGADLAVWMVEAMVTHASQTGSTRPTMFGGTS